MALLPVEPVKYRDVDGVRIIDLEWSRRQLFGPWPTVMDVIRERVAHPARGIAPPLQVQGASAHQEQRPEASDPCSPTGSSGAAVTLLGAAEVGAPGPQGASQELEDWWAGMRAKMNARQPTGRRAV